MAALRLGERVRNLEEVQARVASFEIRRLAVIPKTPALLQAVLSVGVGQGNRPPFSLYCRALFMLLAASSVFVIKNLVKTRLPTGFGEFSLHLYAEHGKEHLALVKGDVLGKTAVPVRMHSECLTGDIFSSRRCDCGDQLRHSLQYLGRAEDGILIYLRQEGRGIGLQKKLEAYNLQDQGMDTVEANIHLGHQPDERDYGIAARILRDLGVASIRLITNNPHKVEALQAHRVTVESRIPIEVGQHRENLGYLRSKAERMSHLLSFRERMPEHHELAFIEPLIDQLVLAGSAEYEFPFVTLSYVQSLDGCIAPEGGTGWLSGSKQVLTLTRYLRSHHDGHLVSVDSLLADTPGLSERYGAAEETRWVILDPELRITPDCHVFAEAAHPPIILTATTAHPDRRALLAGCGAHIIPIYTSSGGDIDIRPVLAALANTGIRTLMVEGDGHLISTLLQQNLVNYCVITIAPRFTGGLKTIEGSSAADAAPLTITDCQYQPLGADIIAFGPVRYG